MRSIQNILTAIDAPIDDLITFRAMPTRSIGNLDPFLFLNHHGPQTYPPDNNGLPFGPHPHKGFETLTFILKGDLTHMDTSGGRSVIKEGGVQWMTAGRGLVHAEISSDEFKKKGGLVEIIQLWLNLPSRLKQTEPKYTGLQKNKIPVARMDKGKVLVHLVSGKTDGITGPVESLTDIYTSLIEFRKDGTYQAIVNMSHNILFYVVKGIVAVNGQKAGTHDLVVFGYNDTGIEIKAMDDATVIFCHGEPFHEPIVAQGPFVMNNAEEIREAYMEYQDGRMGTF